MQTSVAKKIFAVGVAASTVLMSLAPFAAQAAAHANGTNIKSSDGTVWMIIDGQRRAYTSAGAFLSYGFNSWSGVVDANADDLALPAGSFIPPQDGKIICSDRGTDKGTCYLITGGQKAGFTSAAVFTGLGFSFARAQSGDVSWMTSTTNIDNTTAAHRPGVLVNNSGTVYLVGATGLLGIPDVATFNSWGYSFADVVTANAADKAMSQTGVMATRTAGQLSPTALTNTPGTPASAFSAMLASDNPAANTVIAGQAIAELAKFTISGNGIITNVAMKRIGVSADSTLSAVYLYDGNVRMTDSATVSSGVITFNNPSGLFTVSGSKTFSARANILSGTNGQTVGIQLTGVNNGSLSTMPAGNLHTIATAPSTFAGVNFNATTNPSAASVDPQDDYEMWNNTVSVTNEKVLMKSIKLRQIGSVNKSDLANFRLYVDGVMVGSAVPALDSEGYANFDLGSGITLNTGNRTIKMLGNIVAGSSRTFSFSLREAADAMFIDTQFNQAVLPLANSAAFTARTTGDQSVNAGTLQLIKKSDSPSGDVVLDASSVVLAKYEVKAYGEKMKVESLRVYVDEDDNHTAFTLRNGSLYLDGAQVGSTAAIAADTDSTQGYTEYTFGSSFIVEPGKPRILEVKADIFDNDGTNEVVDADTLRVYVTAGTNNVQKMVSLGYGTYPAAATPANQMTVKTGSLTVAKDTAYANQTMVAPKTAYKIGSYKVQASTSEGVNITNVTVDLDNSVADAFDGSSDITNLYIKVGSYTSTIKATVTDSGNSFSTNVQVPAGQTAVVEIYGDIAASSTDGDGTADTLGSSITVTYTTLSSNTSAAAAEQAGQVLTSTSGTFGTSVDGASPLDRIVAGNQTIEAARFKFDATSETYTVKEIQVKVADATVSSAINMVELYDGSNKIGEGALVQSSNTAALVTGLSLQVPANGSKVVTVKYVLNTIGSGAGTSQVNAVATLDSVKYSDSQGVETTDATDRAANTLYVYKTIPTVTKVDLANQTIINGTEMDLYKFTVTAGSQGPVALKQFVLTTSWSDGGTADTLEVESLKLYEDGVDVTGNVVVQDEDGNSVEGTSGMLEADEDLTVSWASTKESVIAAGTTKTYLVKGTPQGFRMTGADTQGDSVSFNLAVDGAHNGTKIFLNGAAAGATIWGLHTAAAVTGSGTLYDFIWSDNSASPHAVNENASSSGDWANGFKVLNLSLSGQTWSK